MDFSALVLSNDFPSGGVCLPLQSVKIPWVTRRKRLRLGEMHLTLVFKNLSILYQAFSCDWYWTMALKCDSYSYDE